MKNQVIKRAKKIRGKHPPMTEIVGKERKILKIEALYDLQSQNKNFFLFVLKDKAKKSKIKYYLAISLASQSSDIISELAKKDLSKKENFKLIQYSPHIKMYRTSLLLLKECTSTEEYITTKALLQEKRILFRKKIIALIQRAETQ